MIVMAFDIAGRTGIAYGRAGETPRATAVDLGKGRGDAAQFARMIRATNELLTKYRPDIVVYEGPVGGPRTSHFLVGLAACFVGEAARLGHKPIDLNLGSVRKHFLGKHITTRSMPGASKGAVRQEIKRAVIARCHALGWPVRDDDEADACALWDYASATIGRAQAKPLGGLFNERSGIGDRRPA